MSLWHVEWESFGYILERKWYSWLYGTSHSLGNFYSGYSSLHSLTSLPTSIVISFLDNKPSDWGKMEYESNLNLQSTKTEDVEHFSSIIEYFITKQFGSLAHLLIICFGCLIFANLCVFWISILCVLYNTHTHIYVLYNIVLYNIYVCVCVFPILNAVYPVHWFVLQHLLNFM